jgi:Ca-activated chloride channel family protein
VRFEAPFRLVLLAGPAALGVAYLVVQRMRRRYAVRFTSVDLLASVAPRHPGWQRHVSAALLLAALAALVGAVAEPTRDVKIPKQRGAVLLAIDTSGSMAAADVAPSRIDAAEAAAKKFVERLPPGLKIGLLTFDSGARVLVSPTDDRPSLQAAIDSLAVGGGTATGEAIFQCLAAIAALPGEAGGAPAAAAIVLMSDGTPTVGRAGQSPEQTVEEAVAAARRAQVPVDTIAFGTAGGTIRQQGEIVPVPSDPEAMAQIAEATNGESFTAATADQLERVYDRIRQSVGYDTERRDVGIWFTAFGLALGVLAAAAALVWVQRIP